jgi:hypothetical protein
MATKANFRVTVWTDDGVTNQHDTAKRPWTTDTLLHFDATGGEFTYVLRHVVAWRVTAV